MTMADRVRAHIQALASPPCIRVTANGIGVKVLERLQPIGRRAVRARSARKSRAPRRLPELRKIFLDFPSPDRSGCASIGPSPPSLSTMSTHFDARS